MPWKEDEETSPHEQGEEMRRRMFILISLGVALALAEAVGSAPATKLSLSERTFRISFASFTAGLQNTEGRLVVSCPVTMEGSFNAGSFIKRAGATVGSITRTTLTREACRESMNEAGYLQLLTETLPWSVTYRSFSGSLPTISDVQIGMVGMAVRIVKPALSMACLTASTSEEPAGWRMVREGGGAVTSVLADETTILPSPGGLCQLIGTPYYSGPGNLTTPGGSTAITVTLI